MKILVFIKQTPDVNSIKFDTKTNRIIRQGVPLMMNSFDKKAVEEAIRLKERYNADTIVASMGPPQASEVLNEALRMGIDRAALISDQKFGGSDTLATARILSEFARNIKPDLVLTGKFSLDGETSQVPPELAEFLGFHLLSSVSVIEDVSQDSIVVDRDVESGVIKCKTHLPAVLSVSEKINKARAIKPDTPDMSSRIEVFDANRIGLDISGSEYSPTVVTGTRFMNNKREVTMLKFDDDVYQKVLDIISESENALEKPKDIAIEPMTGDRDSILAVAVNDLKISEEISSKCSELALANSLDPIVFGNIPRELSSSLVGSTYYYTSAINADEIARHLYNFIIEHTPRYIVLPSTTDGREIAATIAAKMQLGLTADCIDIDIVDGRLIQYKPAFGGNIVATIYSKTTPQMATVRPGMFIKRIPRTPPKFVELSYNKGSEIEVLDYTRVSSDYPSLDSRNIVLGFGRGLKNRDFVLEILRLAEKLNAAVGASRPMVDLKFLPRQQQIGLTGTSISPAVYINFGISGQLNHVVGTRYSKKIISVNSDPNAEIFQYSDFGIVANLVDFVNSMNSFLDHL